jgi:glutamate racemase
MLGRIRLIRHVHEGKVPPVSDSPIPSSQPHVLVFDSGVGGLSVLREIASLLPGVRLTYAADNAFFPYGTKSESALVARVSSVIRALVARSSPDLVVIACNTASTTALDAVRGFLAIGLLGTATTVATRYTAALIAEFAAGCQVLTCGATELVEQAERKIQGLPVDMAILSSVLGRLFDRQGGEALDVVVLGCTHFPLLGRELAEAAPHAVAWMDSGAAIARRVSTILGARNGSPPVQGAMSGSPNHAIFTAETAAVERMRSALAGFGLPRIAFLGHASSEMP